MNFDTMKIQDITDKDLDTDLKSKSDNGTVKTRSRFTKTRKEFTIKPTSPATQAEVDELRTLYTDNRTVTSWDFSHPTETVIEDTVEVPKVYRVRFKDPISITQMGAKANYYTIADIVLEEI